MKKLRFAVLGAGAGGQQQAAPSTRRDAAEKRRLSAPWKERMAQERVMQPRAAQSIRLTFSRKRRRAKRAVATISKFPRSDALAASPPRSPHSASLMSI